MSLTSITATVTNDPYNGGIVISSEAAVDEIGDAKYIFIRRKKHNESIMNFVNCKQLDITILEDLNFQYLDITSVAGTYYDYRIRILDADGVELETQLFENVLCDFRGLFVGNTYAWYQAGTNFSTETNTVQQVEYVKTLKGKYPYRVANSSTNYYTGTSSGLFLPITDDRSTFIPDMYNEFSSEVLDFLRDGTSKVVKTHDGQIWYVSIDDGPHKIYSQFWGNNAIEFKWTEIGSIKELENDMLAPFYRRNADIHKY